MLLIRVTRGKRGLVGDSIGDTECKLATDGGYCTVLGID